MRVNTIVLGYNDSKYLRRVLIALKHQTSPTKIIYVDDNSEDDGREIAREYADLVIRIRRKKTGYILLGGNLNEGLKHLDRDCQYLMISGSDVIPETEYIEKLIYYLIGRSKVVIVSGRIVGEHSKTARGSGRMIRLLWFSLLVNVFPNNMLWESYLPHKALSLGYSVRLLEDALMYACRPTRMHKAKYGYVMKLLGYTRIHAYHSILTCLRAGKIGTAIKMFAAYHSSLKPYDRELTEYIRRYQKLTFAASLSRAIKHG